MTWLSSYTILDSSLSCLSNEWMLQLYFLLAMIMVSHIRHDLLSVLSSFTLRSSFLCSLCLKANHQAIWLMTSPVQKYEFSNRITGWIMYKDPMQLFTKLLTTLRNFTIPTATDQILFFLEPWSAIIRTRGAIKHLVRYQPDNGTV